MPSPIYIYNIQYNIYRRFLMDPASERPSPFYLRAYHTFICRSKTSVHWTDYAFSQPLEPPLIPPLPIPQQPANDAQALARLRRCMTERDVTERPWLQRVQNTVRRHRAVLNRSMYGSTPIDISSFDTSAPLHVLHPCRKMLQLLQQHMRLSPTLQQMWLRYTELESIENWRQVASLDAHDFTAILHTIHTQYHDTTTYMQGSQWTIPRPWEHLWRQTFCLDSVIGIAPGHTAARRVGSTVPAEKLMGCVHDPKWIFQSPETCRCLWLI